MNTGRFEDDTAEKLVPLLDRGAANLSPGVAYRLQAARQQALARLAGEVETAAGTPTAGGRGMRALTGGAGGGGMRHRFRFWVAALALAGALAYALHWQDVRQERELVEIEAALLASDLPIDALVDKGFQNWLRRGDKP